MTIAKTINLRVVGVAAATLLMVFAMGAGTYASEREHNEEDEKVAVCEWKANKEHPEKSEWRYKKEGELKNGAFLYEGPTGEGVKTKDKDAWCMDQRTVTPKAVTFVDATCDAKGSYTVPTSAGVEYLVDEEVVAAGTYSVTAPAKVTVTAQVTEGYFLDEEAVTEWTHDFAAAANCQAVLGETTGTTTTTQVSTTPTGSANAGGSGSTALFGLAVSSLVVTAGAFIRKFSL